MLNRVNKPIIGKNIARTASLVMYGSGSNIVEGEIVVADKNKQILAAGATVADTDTIYIVEGLGDTYSYVTETGVSVTGVRKLLFSNPIVGKEVKSYLGRAYAAAVEEVVTIVGSTFAPIVGTLYKLRIVYSDTYERPGQVTATYNITATTTSVTDLYTAFVAKINADVNRRIQATTPSSNLVLTGRVLPFDVSDTVNAIDEYHQVAFKAFLFSANFGDVAITYTTRPFPGNGTWQRVRDVEKLSLANQRGITNLIWFPVIKPLMRTVAAATYNSIVIEHEAPYISSDNQYTKKAPMTTEIYIPVGAVQMASILQVLNPWMASADGAFANVSLT
jgi:hypothetical protein